MTVNGAYGTAHMVFCNNDDTGGVVRSIVSDAPTSKVVVISDIPRDRTLFERHSGTLYDYEVFCGARIDDYEGILEMILDRALFLRDAGYDVRLNITHATPLEAYAAREAACRASLRAYAVVGGRAVEIPCAGAPLPAPVSDYALQALRQINDVRGMTMDEVRMDGRGGNPACHSTRTKVFRELRDLGLVKMEENLGNYGGKKPGPKPHVCVATSKGRWLCEAYRSKSVR